MIFYNEVQAVLQSLKSHPEVSDQAFFVDSIKEPLLEGPNDLYHLVFWLYRVKNAEVTMIPVAGRADHYFAQGQFEVIGSCRHCYRETLVRFIINKLTECGGASAQIISWNDDPETVYFDATGQSLQWQVKFVRVRFTIKTYMYSGQCPIEICNPVECLDEF